jgi:hypothetical protein
VSEIDYVRILTLLGNLLAAMLRDVSFGYFEDIKLARFRRGHEGRFRRAHGPSLFFVRVTGYRGPEPFPEEELYLCDCRGGVALSLSPLYLRGLDFRRSAYDEIDLYVFDTWRQKDSIFTYRAIQPQAELRLDAHGELATLFDQLQAMKHGDQILQSHQGLTFVSESEDS